MRPWTVLITAILLDTLGARTLAFDQAPSSPRAPAGVVAGQVVDAVSGTPIGGAAITLLQLSDAVALEALTTRGRKLLTTVDGRYAFRNVGAGRYMISAGRRGYLPGGAGHR